MSAGQSASARRLLAFGRPVEGSKTSTTILPGPAIMFRARSPTSTRQRGPPQALSPGTLPTGRGAAAISLATQLTVETVRLARLDEWGVLKVSAVSWTRFDPQANKALPVGVPPRAEFQVRAGDFLMSRANTAELVGRSVIVSEAPKQLILSDKIVRCSISKLVEKELVNLYNRTSTARNHYTARASGTSDSMKNISRDVILSVPIPLPPLAEQRRVVAKVEQLMKLCDELEAKLRRAEDRASKLVESVVQEMVA